MNMSEYIKPDFEKLAELNTRSYYGERAFIKGCELIWDQYVSPMRDDLDKLKEENRLLQETLTETERHYKEEISHWDGVRGFIDANEDDEDETAWIPHIVLRRLQRLRSAKSELAKLKQ